MKKLLVIVVAAMVAFLPFQGQLYAITFIAEGEVTGTSTFNAVLGNAGAQINFPKGSGYAKGDTYIEVTFDDNSSGYQAITIATDNRNAAASPKYTGIAQGNGLIGETTANQVVPMLWMVNPTVITGGYTFTGAAGEYYVTDLKQGTDATNDPTKGASKCNDVNKNSVCDAGEYTDRNSNGSYDGVMWDGTDANAYRCANGSKYSDMCENHSSTPALVEGIDWEGDGYDGAKPYNSGYASVVYGIAGKTAELSAAAGATNTSGRVVTNGKVEIYVGTDYAGADAQKYKTNQLKVELVTIT